MFKTPKRRMAAAVVATASFLTLAITPSAFAGGSATATWSAERLPSGQHCGIQNDHVWDGTWIYIKERKSPTVSGMYEHLVVHENLVGLNPRYYVASYCIPAAQQNY